MKHEIIYTEDYALIASDEEMSTRDYRVNTQRSTVHYIPKDDTPSYYNNRRHIFKKVIAHRPLTDAPILKGVPLLSKFSKKDDVEKKSRDFVKTLGGSQEQRLAFIDGYLEAKGTYKYTEKDLAEAYERGMNNIDSDGCHIDQPSDDFNDLIQSLQTKRPKYFKRETEVKCTGNNNNGCFLESPGHDCGCVWACPTIINLQGQKELKGEYSYE
jgi:hypothetical protein